MAKRKTHLSTYSKQSRRYRKTRSSKRINASECPSPGLEEQQHQKPSKVKSSPRNVKIAENSDQCFFMNEAQSYSNSELKDNEATVQKILNIKSENLMEIAYENSSSAGKSKEEMKNDVIPSLKCQLCRMCGRKRSALIPIFRIRYENEVLISKKIELHLRLKVKVNDGLPPNICLSCNSMLQAWHDLHESCVAADVVVRRMFQMSSENESDVLIIVSHGSTQRSCFRGGVNSFVEV